MSLWDILIVAMVCLAIFRGYFKGLCRRVSDWVGLVCAFTAATFGGGAITGFIDHTFGINGRDKISEWLVDFFASRVAANPDNQLESLKEWVTDLYLPDSLKDNLYNVIDGSSSEVYVSIYEQMAEVLSNPIWHVIVIILSTMVFYAVLLVLGEVCGLFVHRFSWTLIFDRFLGAIVSGFVMMVVFAFFTALIIFIVPEGAGWLGRSLHNSLMAPMLLQALDAVLKGGFIF